MRETALQKKSICILVNSLAGGGGEKVALTLFEEYQRQGFDVLFFCLEKNDVHSIGRSEVYYLSEQTGHGESGLTKLFSLVGFAFKLKRFVRKKKITLVQSHMYRANYVNVLARKFGSAHKVQISNHGIAGRYLGEGLLGRVNLFLIRWLYPVADQVICPSAGMLDDLKNFGVSCRHSRVVGNPFDVESILSKSKETITRSEFFFRTGRQYLISVGRLEKVKNPAQIVQVLHELVRRYSDLELFMLGTGSEKENLQILATRLGINEKIHFLGQVENPFKYMSHAEIFVSASEFEGFSNVIVEAMISGTAVVSTDCPSGPREILAPGIKQERQLGTGEIENAEYGMLVPVADVKSMVEAIDDLLQNDGKRKHYADNGMIRAKQFNRSRIAGNYLEGLWT